VFFFIRFHVACWKESVSKNLVLSEKFNSLTISGIGVDCCRTGCKNVRVDAP
jgi:hypothetical protein